MTTTLPLYLLISLLSLSYLSLSTHAATLQIVAALQPGGPTAWKRDDVLPTRSTYKLCRDVVENPYTLLCIPGTTAAPASTAGFQIYNGVYTETMRSQKRKPFVLTGQRDGMALAWAHEGAIARVMCVLDNGESVVAHIEFSC